MADAEVTISQEHVLFYYAIGLALTQWAQVEHSVAALVSACARGSLPAGTYARFYDDFRVSTKLKYASRIIEAKLSDQRLVADWIHARERVRALAMDRNKLAHYTAMQWNDHPVGERISLMPWPLSFDDRQQRTSSAGALYIADIEAIRRSFGAMNLTLGNLSRRMWGQKPEPELQEAPKSIGELLAHMKAMMNA